MNGTPTHSGTAGDGLLGPTLQSRGQTSEPHLVPDDLNSHVGGGPVTNSPRKE